MLTRALCTEATLNGKMGKGVIVMLFCLTVEGVHLFAGTSLGGGSIQLSQEHHQGIQRQRVAVLQEVGQWHPGDVHHSEVHQA